MLSSAVIPLLLTSSLSRELSKISSTERRQSSTCPASAIHQIMSQIFTQRFLTVGKDSLATKTRTLTMGLDYLLCRCLVLDKSSYVDQGTGRGVQMDRRPGELILVCAPDAKPVREETRRHFEVQNFCGSSGK